MQRRRAENVGRLLQDVEWARAHGLGPRDLVPMLEKLRANAASGSPELLIATRHLAEVLLHVDPWRAAALARQVLAHAPDDSRAWGILGIAYVALGHDRAAAKAYTEALALDPDCPATAHNLGHLLDSAFGLPGEGLPWLERAHRALPADPEISASFAHALTRVGRVPEARKLLFDALDGDETRVEELLVRWSGEQPRDASVEPPFRGLAGAGHS